MTQPDGYTPSGALTSTGLSAYAGKTQADWENEQKSLVTGRFSGAQTGFYSLVIGKIPIIGDVVEIFTGIEDGNRYDLGTAVNNVKSAIGSAWQGVIKGLTNTWNALWNGLTGNTTGTGKSHVNVQTAAAAVTSKANDAYTNADTADGKAQGAIDGINQAVTGATGTGATAGTVATNISNLKATPTNLLNSLLSAYKVDTITIDMSPKTWNKPDGITELYVVLFGGGSNGATGGVYTGLLTSSVNVAGGTGGAPGAVIALQIEPTNVGSSVTVTIGTPSSPTTSFGSIVSTADAFAAYVATPLGLLPTANAATVGGKGGGYNNGFISAETGGTTTAGVAGGAAGGLAYVLNGTDANGGTGGGGGAGINFGLCQTGGAGGGGGGFAYTTSTGKATGGKGGAGGFPGGGGGGGGAAVHSTNSANRTAGGGGNGANGVALIIYKIAKTTA